MQGSTFNLVEKLKVTLMKACSKKVTVLLVLLLLLVLTGCSSNLGAAKEQLQPFWPETYLYATSPAEAWVAVKKAVDLHVGQYGRVLVKDSDNQIVTWVEHLEVGPDAGRRRKKKDPEESPFVILRRSEVKEVGDGGLAITTVMLSPFGEGSKMRVRRSYYGRLTCPLMVHSRGEFAHLFHDLVSKELAAKGIAYVPSQAVQSN